MSRNVVEIAELAAEQRRNILRMRRRTALDRLRDRLRERQGLLSPEERQVRRALYQWSRPGATTTAAGPTADVVTESHRVQVEARRASRAHAEHVRKLREHFSQRVQARLAARDKATK